MNKQYHFKLLEHSTSGRGYAIYKKITIDMLSFALDGRIELCLEFSVKPSQKSEITKLEIHTKSTSVSHEKSYFVGFFEFSNVGYFEDAVDLLKRQVNGENISISEVETPKWNEFKNQFVKWFDLKIRKCIEKEEEAFNLYFNADEEE